MQTISIEGCELATWSVGSGRPLVVIAGGPGLASDYLAPLEALGDRFRVVFFDQPGCGHSPSSVRPTARQAVDATIAVIKSLADEPFAVVAHSWGAYLAAAACLEIPTAPASTVLLNPVPFDRAGFDAVGARLVERVDAETLSRIGELTAEGTPAAGRELMRLAMPAYCGRPNDLPNIAINYGIATADSVNASLGDYDVRAAPQRLGRLALLFGSTDYIKPSDFDGVAGHATTLSVESGHFSMLDARAEVVRLVGNFVAA